jgi:hypothetical protein
MTRKHRAAGSGMSPPEGEQLGLFDVTATNGTEYPCAHCELVKIIDRVLGEFDVRTEGGSDG